MRKLFATILTFILLFNVCLLPVCAAEQPTVQPRYLDIYSFSIDLDISAGGTATCSTGVKTTTQTNTIDLTMELEKYNGTRWVVVKSWSDSFGPEADMTKYWAIPSGCDYRVYVGATVFDKNGNAVETVGNYSGEIYY